MKNQNDRTAAAALRVLTSINRELIANRRDRERRDRRLKETSRVIAEHLAKSGMLPPEVVRAVKTMVR